MTGTPNQLLVLCLAIVALLVLAGCSNSAAGNPVPSDPVADPNPDPTPVRGDGVVKAWEQCDDGNGCAGDCIWE